jgi:hypothetical protein
MGFGGPYLLPTYLPSLTFGKYICTISHSFTSLSRISISTLYRYRECRKNSEWDKKGMFGNISIRGVAIYDFKKMGGISIIKY